MEISYFFVYVQHMTDTLLFKIIFDLFILCVSVLPAYMFVYCAHAYYVEARRGHGVDWNWRYEWLWDTTWVLGFKCGSSARATSVLKCGAISPALTLFYKNKMEQCVWSKVLWEVMGHWDKLFQSSIGDFFKKIYAFNNTKEFLYKISSVLWA